MLLKESFIFGKIDFKDGFLIYSNYKRKRTIIMCVGLLHLFYFLNEKLKGPFQLFDLLYMVLYISSVLGYNIVLQVCEHAASPLTYTISK